MRIAHVTTTPSTGLASAMAQRYPMLGRIPEEQHAAGHQVALFCRSDQRSRERWRGLTLGTVAGPNRLVACAALVDEVEEFGAEVVHLHGITVSACLLASMLRARRPEVVIAIQDQAFHWPPSLAGRLLIHLGLACSDLVFFAVRSQAEPLLAASAVRDAQIAELPGGSSDFVGLSQAAARQRTHLRGSPLYLWVGRLVPVKDPLTAMRALAAVLARHPKARLALVYGDETLYAEVREILSPVWDQVDDLGFVPHDDLPALYSAADVFVLTSERESWCSALLEALACGASPVVSDVPANLAIIGSQGQSFPIGDAKALEEALEAPLVPRQAARQHFAAHLTFAELARQSLAAYAEALSRPRRAPGRC